MRKLSFCASLALLASLASCSEATETSSFEPQAVSTTFATTAEETKTTLPPEPIIFDVSPSELDKPISGTLRNPAFSMRVSSSWKSTLTFDYGQEMVSGLFFRINAGQTDKYSDNSDFIKEFLDSEPNWTLYKNKSGVEFAYVSESVDNAYEKERSVFKFYNNGILITVFIGTKSTDGLTSLSPSSVYNIIDTVELTTPEPETTQPDTTIAEDKSLSFSGSGDTVTKTFNADGCTRIKGEYKGESYFNVTLYDSEGNYESMVFSNVGQYTGEKVFKFEADKQYMFEVSAKEGDWKISIE